MKINVLFKKAIACISCMAMTFIMVGTTTFAASGETRNIGYEVTMGTMSEFEHIQFKPEGSPASVNATSMYLGHFQFTGTNTGSWKTVGNGNARHVRMCIAFKPVDGITYSTELYVELYQYKSVFRGKLHGATWMTSPDADGYYFFVSDYFDISPNSDCRMQYLATSSGTTFSPRTVDVHAWYDYY